MFQSFGKSLSHLEADVLSHGVGSKESKYIIGRKEEHIAYIVLYESLGKICLHVGRKEKSI